MFWMIWGTRLSCTLLLPGGGIFRSLSSSGGRVPAGIKSLRGGDKYEMLEALYPKLFLLSRGVIWLAGIGI